MSGISIIAMLVIGGLAGWLAELIVKGRGLGLIGNIAVGIAGAVVAALVFPLIGLSFGGGTGATVVHATIGAVLLLVLIRVVKKA